MEVVSFSASLAVSFVLFAVLMLAFEWLKRRPCNAVIYYPKQILKDAEPSEGRLRSKSPFDWINEAVGASEADVVAAAGVDSAVYLLFLSSAMAIALKILFFSGIILLPVLLPLAGTDQNLKYAVLDNRYFSFSNLDKLCIGNVQNRSPRLWAFLLAAYWVSFITYYVLWKAYSHALNLRSTALASDQGLKPEHFAVLVRDIPPPSEGQTVKEHADSYFRALHGESFYKSVVITDNKKANKIWKEIERYTKKLARAQVAARSDAIDSCKNKIKELLSKLEAEQMTTQREKQQAAALVFFENRAAAVCASQTLHAHKIGTWIVTEAPESCQLLWENLPKKFNRRLLRSVLINAIVFFALCLCTVPFALLPILSFLVEVGAVFVPQVIIAVFLALLSPFLVFLSKKEGVACESYAVVSATRKHFYFGIINVFIEYTIFGALYDNWDSLSEQPYEEFMPTLGLSLPKISAFFITYISFRFFVLNGLEISRLIPLIIFHFKKKLICKTEDEVREAWAPGDLGYASRVPNDLLILAIVLAYSVTAPIVIPFGIAYFCLGWLVARNQLPLFIDALKHAYCLQNFLRALKVFIPKYEMNGRMWPQIHDLIVASLIIFQACTMIYLILWKKFYYAPLLIPLIIFSFKFAHICKKYFHIRNLNCTSLEAAKRDAIGAPDMESMYESYVPPFSSEKKLEELRQLVDAQPHSVIATSAV